MDMTKATLERQDEERKERQRKERAIRPNNAHTTHANAGLHVVLAPHQGEPEQPLPGL